jgi:iron complex outermembrane receptor protein
MGTFAVGGLATYVLSWKTSVSPLAPVFENVNEFGYPQAFRARGQVRWDKDVSFGNFNAGLFVNYANSYHIDPSKLPGSMSAAQKEQYSHIDSYTTFDLTLGFDTGDRGSWIANDIGILFSVQNLFNARPPLVVNQASTAGAGVQFDPTFASPLGRAFQVQVSKKF